MSNIKGFVFLSAKNFLKRRVKEEGNEAYEMFQCQYVLELFEQAEKVENLEQRARRAEDELIYWKDKDERLEKVINT
ncbi:hypothetical protein [Thalassobacillus sp. C254]|uniref:hypothetical protein n=1 Tax=Thalassobacillus sp. C254 TaxID=1225341 RepID=UPI0006D16CB1|nr:hypothetical protein [Thalassobacillus sp. C254]